MTLTSIPFDVLEAEYFRLRRIWPGHTGGVFDSIFLVGRELNRRRYQHYHYAPDSHALFFEED